MRERISSKGNLFINLISVIQQPALLHGLFDTPSRQCPFCQEKERCCAKKVVTKSHVALISKMVVIKVAVTYADTCRCP